MNGFHATYGPGVKTCSDYREARALGGIRLDLYQNFAFGYLAAFNLISPRTYDILGVHSMGDALLWVSDYCRDNPTENFTNALAMLTVAYYDERTNFKRSDGWFGESSSARESAPSTLND
ncbi:hypothetical protein D5085_04365 [Ectothiorhodospiraceae bacterium BW-2]|nr:hypothetical protein D5085_04365 [Ectothiorhodospiraceae bacterium BW-2]